MKLFILLLSLAVALADEEHHHHQGTGYVVRTHDDLVRYRNLCAEKVHATPEQIAHYVKWEYPESETAGCYLKCVFEQFGFFDAEHGFNVHNIHEQLAGGAHVDHTDETHKKIEDCTDNNSQGSDACTWAYRGGTCFLRNNLQLVQNSVKA